MDFFPIPYIFYYHSHIQNEKQYRLLNIKFKKITKISSDTIFIYEKSKIGMI